MAGQLLAVIYRAIYSTFYHVAFVILFRMSKGPQLDAETESVMKQVTYYYGITNYVSCYTNNFRVL